MDIGPSLVEIGPTLIDSVQLLVNSGPMSADSVRNRAKFGRFWANSGACRAKVQNWGRIWPTGRFRTKLGRQWLNSTHVRPRLAQVFPFLGKVDRVGPKSPTHFGGVGKTSAEFRPVSAQARPKSARTPPSSGEFDGSWPELHSSHSGTLTEQYIVFDVSRQGFARAAPAPLPGDTPIELQRTPPGADPRASDIPPCNVHSCQAPRTGEGGHIGKPKWLGSTPNAARQIGLLPRLAQNPQPPPPTGSRRPKRSTRRRRRRHLCCSR